MPNEKPKRPWSSYWNPFSKAEYDKKVKEYERKKKDKERRARSQPIDYAARVKERPPMSAGETRKKETPKGGLYGAAVSEGPGQPRKKKRRK